MAILATVGCDCPHQFCLWGQTPICVVLLFISMSQEDGSHFFGLNDIINEVKLLEIERGSMEKKWHVEPLIKGRVVETYH